MLWSHRSWGKRIQGCVAALIGFCLAILFWAPGWLDSWENKTWDLRVKVLARPGAATDKIRIILLDQNSLDWAKNENGLSWPWPREVYSAIINFCKRSGAQSLSFDVLFTEPSKYGVEDDKALGSAIEQYGRFVESVFLGRDTGEETSWPPGWPEPGWKIAELSSWIAEQQVKNLTFPRATFPVRELAAPSAVLANVHLNPDPDGTYRRARLFGVFDGRVLPSLPLGAYLSVQGDSVMSIAGKNFTIGKKKIPLDDGGKVILNFRGASGTHRTVSAAAVIQSELRLLQNEEPTIKDKNVFRNCHVLFGFSAPGLFDLRPTPVSGVYPGVEIHATMLDNLLANDFIHPVTTPVVLFLTFLTVLLTGLVTAALSGIVRNFIAYGLFILLPVLMSILAYHLGYWLPLVVQETAVVFTLFSAGVIYYSTEGRQKTFIKNAFKQYLSPAVIEELIQHPDRLKLGGERREISIFFSDLEGFTSISEGMEPEQLTALLNEYLSVMTDIIQEEGGTVDKYEGDAIIAFWNAPLPQTDHAVRCVRAALRCQSRLEEMQPDLIPRIGRALRMRIGINTGPAIVGNMGSRTHFDYTMLGDAVNLASRLEGINKQFGTYTIISESTLKQIGGAFPVRELSRVAVVGRKGAVTIYEPFNDREYTSREKDFRVFARGLDQFYLGHFQQAAEIFRQIEDIDPAAKHYLVKCRELIASPPAEWHGVWVITTK